MTEEAAQKYWTSLAFRDYISVHTHDEGMAALQSGTGDASLVREVVIADERRDRQVVQTANESLM